jgi:cysteine desulfurase / selenocysteine lyase
MTDVFNNEMWQKIRSDFPILSQELGENKLCYLDNAASSQMPQTVLDTLIHYYKSTHSNVHRGVHQLSQKATDVFEESRNKIAKFIGASSSKECIFVRGATEGINLTMQSYGRSHVNENDEIVITQIEHHSNIVPWQLLAESKKAILKVASVTSEGEIDLNDLYSKINKKTKVVAVSHISNVLGNENPIGDIAKYVHNNSSAIIVVDGCQAIPHLQINVKDLNVDFYTFSGHKMYGPTGIGVLYGKESLLEQMPPFQGGGDMISSVSFEKTTYNCLPYKFEAGTPAIAPAVALGAAIDYLQSIGFQNIIKKENQLNLYGRKVLAEIDGLIPLTKFPKELPIFSFNLKGLHPHDVGTLLDSFGIAVRVGYHCAEPLLQKFNSNGCIRASLSYYNTEEELDRLAFGLIEVQKILN